MSAANTPAGPVRVRVPASSANLGPGFDTVAVAVDLTLEVTAVPFAGRRVVADGEGAGELTDGDDNLVWRGVTAFCAAHDVDLPDVTLHCDNRIPLERGLGSSSAAAVAGLVLARHLTGVAVGDGVLIDHATQLEGHPDNAAAAVLGGLVVAGDGRARRFEPSRTLRPVACIPTQRSATSASRGLLPTTVPLSTMVDTVRDATLVVTGLAGLGAWEPRAMRDAVHEPPRLAAMPASGRLVEAARAAGYAACLSGAGPAVLVVARADDGAVTDRLAAIAGDGWRVCALDWDRAGARVDARVAAAP